MKCFKLCEKPSIFMIALSLWQDQIVVNIVYREEKKNYCTGPDCILIDDFEKTIREWEALGGTGIWHHSAEETLRKLQEIRERN